MNSSIDLPILVNSEPDAIGTTTCAGVRQRFPDDVQAALARDAMRRLETEHFVIYYPEPRRAEIDRFLVRAERCADVLRANRKPTPIADDIIATIKQTEQMGAFDRTGQARLVEGDTVAIRGAFGGLIAKIRSARPRQRSALRRGAPSGVAADDRRDAADIRRRAALSRPGFAWRRIRQARGTRPHRVARLDCACHQDRGAVPRR